MADIYCQRIGTTILAFNKYDIWLAKVYFEENTEYKERPVLILNNTAFFISAYKITSQGRTGDSQSPIKQWKEAGLNKESYIVFEKAIRLDKTDLIRKIGKLQITDIYALEMKRIR